MNKTLILAIDPGKNGGLALMSVKSGKMVVRKMPPTEADIAKFISTYRERILLAAVELVSIRPGQGISSSGKFMVHFGVLRGILAALDIPRVYIQPHRWQAVLGVPKRGDKSSTDHKNILKALAQNIFPSMTFTLATADAALIAEWARITRFAS